MPTVESSCSARKRAVWAALVATCVALFSSEARAAGDPYLRWYTVETPHFRIHYHSGLDWHAQRLANLAETIHTRLVPHLGWDPKEVTEVVLTDDTDGANGSARALPYNLTRLFISAPDDMSVLGDFDDWLSVLFTHEHTHILHLDNITGLPAIVNTILGKTIAPNQSQPRWILEGLATHRESEHTSAGRIRATQFDMFLRADVLEDNIAPLDQMSHSVRRWPGSNIWYLYGGRFFDWIHKTYGKDTIATIATDYGANPIPWGLNRSIRRATGSTYEELWRGWVAYSRKHYRAQARRIKKRGLRQGTRLTRHGRGVGYPRFAPPCARKGQREEIYYSVDDGHRTAGIYRLPLDSRTRAAEKDAELVARGGSTVSFDPECGLVFSLTAPSKRRFRFQDIFRQKPGTRSSRGPERSRSRWTVGRRARTPAVSPDGRRIVYVTNRAGTTTLRIASIRPEGGVHRERALVPSVRFEQAFTPSWSPDGKRVAYSVWTRGGYRDVRVVDVKTGKFWQITRDRALDQQPTFAPDGRHLYFASDRTGVSNIYAYNLETAKLRQVTNVVNGAYMPELTPDGKTLFYVGYTHDGFDLYSMPVDEGRWLRALPPPTDRPDPPMEPPTRRWPVEKYRAIRTLRPYAYDFEYGDGTFGRSLTIGTSGADAVGLHAFAAEVTGQTELSQPVASMTYSYRRLPFDLRTTVFANAAPRRDFRFGDQAPIVTERSTGLSTGLSYGIPGIFQSQTLSLSYSVRRFKSTLPVASLIDPFALTPRDPFEGFLAIVTLGWSYSTVHSSAYAISSERGFRVAAVADYADEATGSEVTLTSIRADMRGFVEMPWLRHHVLALSAQGGNSTGSYPRRGLFFTGGFVDQSVLDSFIDNVGQGAFVLRGYSPRKFVGSAFTLMNAEYRFPIAYPDRGMSTLPIFLRSISGAVFVDYGGAFNRLNLDNPRGDLHLGYGAELWINLVAGYFNSGNIRVGYARGTDSEAVRGGQTYFLVASPF